MNILINGNTTIQGNQVWINGTLLPPAPCKGDDLTIINNKVFIDGYEFKNGKWRRTLRAFWHLWF